MQCRESITLHYSFEQYGSPDSFRIKTILHKRPAVPPCTVSPQSPYRPLQYTSPPQSPLDVSQIGERAEHYQTTKSRSTTKYRVRGRGFGFVEPIRTKPAWREMGYEMHVQK